MTFLTELENNPKMYIETKRPQTAKATISRRGNVGGCNTQSQTVLQRGSNKNSICTKMACRLMDYNRGPRNKPIYSSHLILNRGIKHIH